MTYTRAEQAFKDMPGKFNSDAVGDLDAIFQFELEAGIWHIFVKSSGCQVHEGEHDDPTVTMGMSDKTWLKMCNGQLTGVQAFMLGKVKVSGNMMLAPKFGRYFGM